MAAGAYIYKNSDTQGSGISEKKLLALNLYELLLIFAMYQHYFPLFSPRQKSSREKGESENTTGSKEDTMKSCTDVSLLTSSRFCLGHTEDMPTQEAASFAWLLEASYSVGIHNLTSAITKDRNHQLHSLLSSTRECWAGTLSPGVHNLPYDLTC